MRRNLAGILLFSLALAVQALASATAGLAHSALGQGQICATLADQTSLTEASLTQASDATSAAPIGHADIGPGLCDLCALCCGGAGPFAARPEVSGVLSSDWAAAQWRAPVARAVVFAADHARRARAPPLSI
ncbi:hypothetical protein [Methylosinus sp. LW3]|uniref:hypothetical protein n=1 Tax=Methylosinus sp. LW3 TaxID=107635 RepID=UPI0004B2E379|nr:hypothetical protein [Methylosinus sp. LW3]